MKSLKILAVGNSFSMDAMEYLWNIAHNAGYQEIILGDLYIPGCSLETHWKVVKDNLAGYEYYKNTHGTWEIINNTSLLDALSENNWDVITIQQASDKSGLKETFEPYLTELQNYILKQELSEKAKVAWHMTWAYESTHTNPAFGHFDFNQLKMYQAIVECVKTCILNNSNFDFVIASGTAIQNARTSSIGDHLTRDGYHLSLGLGRYIAGLMWFKAITNESIEEISYYPEGVTETEMKIAKAAVKEAFQHSFQVTSINK